METHTETSGKKHTRTYKGRSRQGCLPCRTLHLKCDEQLPSCRRCERHARDCIRPIIILTQRGESGLSQTTTATTTAASSPSTSSPSTSTIARPVALQNLFLSSLSKKTQPPAPLTTPTPPRSSPPTPRPSHFVQPAPFPTILGEYLGDPLGDPSGVFKSINAPYLPNLQSLFYWLTLTTERFPGGFGGLANPIWVEMIRQDCITEPALLSFAAHDAATLYGVLTDDHASAKPHKLRSNLLTIQELRRYHKVTATFLMIVINMAAILGQEGDLASQDTHLAAVKNLYNEDIEFTPLQWLRIWGKDSIISLVRRKPRVLPEMIPHSLKRMFVPSIEEMALHRSAAQNAASMVRLLGPDYLLVSGLIQDTQLLCGLLHSKDAVARSPATHSMSIPLEWRVSSFLVQTNQEYSAQPSPANRCRQILATALRSCVWQEVAPWVSQRHTAKVDESTKATFNEIDEALIVDMQIALGMFCSAEEVVDAWSKLADLEPLLWIACMLSKLESRYDREGAFSWARVLVLTAARIGLPSEAELIEALHRWPVSSGHVHSALDVYTSLSVPASPSLSASSSSPSSSTKSPSSPDLLRRRTPPGDISESVPIVGEMEDVDMEREGE